LIGTNGDELHHSAALKSGADVFILKPYESLAAFQQTLLDLFPPLRTIWFAIGFKRYGSS